MRSEKPAGHCPACRRYVGPADVCPYCGAEHLQQRSIRRLRYAALLLGIVGVGCLLLAARSRERPAIQVAAITPMMNFAQVRIEGEVCRAPFIAEDHTYLSFLLGDGTGNIRVAAHRAVARELIAAAAVQGKGDTIVVEGQLDLRAGKTPRLVLRTRKGLKIQRRE